MTYWSHWVLLLLGMLLNACRGQQEAPADRDNIQFEVPGNFPEPTYTLDKNPVTQEGFTLGKMLFADPIMSRDSTVACSHCHVQGAAFADPQHRLSIGVDGQFGPRNAPSLSNLAFKAHFLWDGGVTHVDFTSVFAIENEREMDMNLSTVVARLREHTAYLGRFEKAFGSDSINSGRTLHALSQYLVMLISANSRYDQFVRNEGVLLTDQELAGLEVFEAKCSSCHPAPLFTSQGFANNGLDSSFTPDVGRYKITEKAGDKGKFSIPSLRNVALTAPYMHDGRLAILEEVLSHYDQGMVPSPTLADGFQQTNGTLGIPLSGQEQAQIIAFLHTLTDDNFITNPDL